MRTGVSLAEALRRYRNARRRALYWSGTPSYSRQRTGETKTSELEWKYGLAMSDCRSWEQIIERLTGKKLKRYDPKKKFGEQFYKR